MTAERRMAPGVAGAPAVPGQRAWLRYTTDSNGRITGLWAYSNSAGEEPVEIPITRASLDWPSPSNLPTFTFTVPAVYVSEA